VRSLLLLLFVLVPLVELYLLLWLGRTTGFAATLGMTLVSGIVGSWLARRQGLLAYRAWKRSLDSLSPPEMGLVEGLLILVGAVLLLTPGLLTDVAGFVLLVPWSRRIVAKRVKASIEKRLLVRASSTAAPRRPPTAVVESEGRSLDDV
jgi:UPF0716 protein FxsA